MPFLKDDIVSLKVGTLARIAVEILFVVLASTGLRQAQPDNCSSIDKTIKRLKIKNAWVENCWSYECINNKAVLVKKKTQQFVIDYEYKAPENDSILFCLWKLKEKSGSCLGGILDFKYIGEDTLKLELRENNRRELEILKFWKNK